MIATYHVHLIIDIIYDFFNIIICYKNTILKYVKIIKYTIQFFTKYNLLPTYNVSTK